MPNDSLACNSPIRADLHCHSSASSEAGEAMLGAIRCPESFSDPDEVYSQARRRGMRFVTITDHDCIDGVAKIAGQPGVLAGEELTCFFPEDRCKIHLLIWGITPRHHEAVQASAGDIYTIARYVEENQLAHAVAHPVYRQNDKLELWHLERLILLFKGFECLNGSHSLLHRQAFEPLLDELTPRRIGELSEKHRINPLWPDPWHKARTGGSDDHGLFNIGRTWTEFPADTDSVTKLLSCLREGRCAPGGEAGSSLKLAHNFYGVGIRYATRQMAKSSNSTTALLEALVGERSLRKRDLIRAAIGRSAGALGGRLRRPLGASRQGSGFSLVTKLLCGSIHREMPVRPALLQALRAGESPFARHQAMFDLICQLDRETTEGIAQSIAAAISQGRVGPVFDAISSIAAQQFLLLPYYFSLFHQNRERPVLDRVTGRSRLPNRDALKVGVFTDTFEEINGVSRFLQTMGGEAIKQGRSLTIHTCTAKPKLTASYRKNFQPLLSCPLPGYPQIALSLPPLAQVLEWADCRQFDAIHVHTPGPMGMCGLMAAAMLRVPLLATYHTDFPSYVDHLTGDHRLTVAAEAFMGWFYGKAQTVLSRSRRYERVLHDLGIASSKVRMVPACVDGETFHPRHRDVNLWHDLRIPQPHRLLYVGRVSAEKNLAMLAQVFRRVCGRRCDVALVVAGDGPFVPAFRAGLNGLPAYFLGHQSDERLAPLYASSDLLVFPSCTDTLGQVVLEAQAAGLPVLVSDEGGPAEVMEDALTGAVLPASDVGAWVEAIDRLLGDDSLRLRMARTAPHRVARWTPARTFEACWDEHIRAADEAAAKHSAVPPVPVCKAQERSPTASHGVTA